MASKQLIFEVLALAKAEGFEAAARKVESLGKSSDTVTASFERQQKNAHLLSTSLLAVGSAAIPLAGAATGALVGFGAAAGVAAVGVLGIRDAMKQGTPLGKQYQAAFRPIVTEFGLLKQVGARGLFDGINSGVKSLKPLFPVLNRDVSLFSAQMGQVVGHVGPGMVALFTRLNPLFATIGEQLVHGSAGFEQWAKSSDAVGRFVAYVQTTLPQVEATIGSLITTASHLVVAAEPFGGTTLTAIRLFSQAINAIPVGVLQTIVPLLLGLKVGNTLANSFTNAGVGLGKFAKNLAGSSSVASGASGLFGKLGGVVGKLGPIGVLAGAGLGVVSAVLGRSKQATIEQTKRVNDLTEALQNGTAAVGVWNNALATGAAKATQAGLTQKQIVTALSGTTKQYESAQQRLADYEASEDSAALAGGRFGASSQEVAQRQQEVRSQVAKLKDALAESRKEYEAAKAQVADYARQQGDSVLASQIANGQLDKTAKALGLTSSQYINAKLAADQNTLSTQQATAAMVLENNAAGLLSASLDQLGGNNLGVAQAQTAVASATNSAVQALKSNGTVLAGNSEKALANQQALQAAASAAIAHGQAVAKQTGSTVKATSAIQADKAALEANLRSQGRLTPAVQNYIDTLFKIPPVRKTKVDAQTETALSNVRTLLHYTDLTAGARHIIFGADTGSAYAKLQALNSYIQNMLHPVIEPRVAGDVGHGRLEQRAAGGPVKAGTAYIVGEYRPEVFVPDSNGRIIPNVKAAPAGTSVQNSFTINVPGLVGGQEAARQIVAALERWPGQINIGRKVR